MARLGPVPTTVLIGVKQSTNQDNVRASTEVIPYAAEDIPTAMIEEMLFNDLGGIELINISRHDEIDGIDIDYSLIGDLTSLQNRFNSNNIISGFEDRHTYFSQRQIDVGSYMRDVFLDADGNLVIEFDELDNDINVEVMILRDGIIYTDDN